MIHFSRFTINELLFTIFVLGFLPGFCLAQGREVIINEVCWMGSEQSHYDEWMELKNTGPEPVSLEDWILKTEDGSPSIRLQGEMEGGHFFLLERTDDTTQPDIKADQIYTGGLSNQGENIQLLDKGGEVVDKVKAGQGWKAGDNITKKTMERGKKGWHTSRKKGGTPKAENTEPPALVNPQKGEEKTLPKAGWQKPANKRFLKTLFLGLSVSLLSATFAIIMKRVVNR